MASISSNAVVGNWNTGSSWVGGVVPVDGDDVTIVGGAIITANSGATTSNSQTVTVAAGGTLKIGHPFAITGTLFLSPMSGVRIATLNVVATGSTKLNISSNGSLAIVIGNGALIINPHRIISDLSALVVYFGSSTHGGPVTSGNYFQIEYTETPDYIAGNAVNTLFPADMGTFGLGGTVGDFMFTVDANGNAAISTTVPLVIPYRSGLALLNTPITISCVSAVQAAWSFPASSGSPWQWNDHFVAITAALWQTGTVDVQTLRGSIRPQADANGNIPANVMEWYSGVPGANPDTALPNYGVPKVTNPDVPIPNDASSGYIAADVDLSAVLAAAELAALSPFHQINISGAITATLRPFQIVNNQPQYGDGNTVLGYTGAAYQVVSGTAPYGPWTSATLLGTYTMSGQASLTVAVPPANVPWWKPGVYYWIGDGGTNDYATAACYLLNGRPAPSITDGITLVVNNQTPGYIAAPAAGVCPIGRVTFLNFGVQGASCTVGSRSPASITILDCWKDGGMAGIFRGTVILRSPCDLSGADITAATVYKAYVDNAEVAQQATLEDLADGLAAIETQAAAAATNTADLPGMLQSDGGGRKQFTVAALAQVPAGSGGSTNASVFTGAFPAGVLANAPTAIAAVSQCQTVPVSPGKLVVYQYSAFVNPGTGSPLTIAVTDQAGNPISLAGRTIEILATSPANRGTILWKWSTNDVLAIVGAAHNIIEILADSTRSQASGDYLLFAWDITAGLPEAIPEAAVDLTILAAPKPE